MTGTQTGTVTVTANGRQAQDLEFYRPDLCLDTCRSHGVV
jgi:hypothetical protein